MCSRLLSIPVLVLSLSAVFAEPPAGYRTSAEIKRVFADPPREYGTAPLWVWNDNLTDTQVIESLRDFARQKVKQAFVHPRPGLMTPYLSPEWFRLWKLALAEAERLDMNLWIYDENSYPSGFGGGFVPEAMPESRGRGVAMQETPEPPQWSDALLAVFLLNDAGYEDVSAKIRRGDKLPPARYLSVSISRARPGPWYGGKFYVDLLYPGVTQKFLEITLDAYKREIGGQFGKHVPGSFTDEPQLRPAGGLPWTDDLPAQFEKRWGYRLTDHLPALWAQVGDWKKVRHNYFQTLLDLFVERWARPYYEYCAKNQLEFTGHYWEHEWPNCVSVPDNMAMSAWQQRPGIDILMNQYKEDTHAQFGNVRSVKEIASLANQLGRRRTLCEAYGAGGWDLRFEDMKRIGDWMYALGVNTLDQHLAYVTLRGARKRDHPQAFTYHEPWWDAYHVSATYFSRLSLALSQGQQINHILLLEPTTTAWMYNAMQRSTASTELNQIGDSFQSLVVALEKAQVEFDLGCEDVIADHGSVQGKTLKIGQRAYDLVLIPPMTENLNSSTADLLARFLGGGGVVLSCSEPPQRVNGSPSEKAAGLQTAGKWTRMKPADLVDSLAGPGSDGLKIHRKPGDQGILYHHRRRLADGDLLFLVNSSIEQPTAGMVVAAGAGLEEWGITTGETKQAAFTAGSDSVQFSFELPPSGSRLFFISREKRKPAVAPVLTSTPVPASAQMSTMRIGPNVLVLDYVDVEVAGEKQTSSYFYPAGQFLFKKNGFDRNPWDSAVQFRDELISRRIPTNDGFEARYRFKIEGSVPNDLVLVVERPDLYTISCNGQPVKPSQGEWWLDRAFGKINISSAARTGENEVLLHAGQFSIYHELEAAYLLGTFRLKAVEQGFVVAPDSEARLGPWNEQGMPFYSQGMAYSTRFDVEKPGTYEVRLPAWYGSVAKVLVNGQEAGYILAPPWSLDVSRWIKAGNNQVEVVVIGTLKNTLGPHHGKPALGTAWPAMFTKGPQPGPPPGEEYSTVGYGLFEPFQLVEME
jgi:hypothetical protein